MSLQQHHFSFLGNSARSTFFKSNELMTTFAYCAPCYLLYDSMTRMGSISLLHMYTAHAAVSSYIWNSSCLSIASKRIKGTVSQDYNTHNSLKRAFVCRNTYIQVKHTHNKHSPPPPKKKTSSNPKSKEMDKFV
jgi:hypothetical protein